MCKLKKGLSMTFGENLRNLRKERNLSIKELSAASGLSAVHISNYEHDHHVPNAININKLAVALGCTYEELNR